MEIQRSTRKAAKQSASLRGGRRRGGGGGLSSVGNIEAWEEALDFFFHSGLFGCLCHKGLKTCALH